jgi:ribosomal protein L37AE/L43A
MTTTCVKCGEAQIAPDWSEFVSEHLVLNLWSCTKCGDRFETRAFMPADAAPKMSEKDWEEMFPPLLVA